MQYKTVDTPVGLAESELVSYRRDSDELTVELLTWNGTRLQLVFGDVILFLDRDCGDTTALRELEGHSELLAQALKSAYERPAPSDHPYKHYQLLNLDDTPVLEVISGALRISHAL